MVAGIYLRLHLHLPFFHLAATVNREPVCFFLSHQHSRILTCRSASRARARTPVDVKRILFFSPLPVSCGLDSGSPIPVSRLGFRFWVLSLLSDISLPFAVLFRIRIPLLLLPPPRSRCLLFTSRSVLRHVSYVSGLIPQIDGSYPSTDPFCRNLTLSPFFCIAALSCAFCSLTSSIVNKLLPPTSLASLLKSATFSHYCVEGSQLAIFRPIFAVPTRCVEV